MFVDSVIKIYSRERIVVRAMFHAKLKPSGVYAKDNIEPCSKTTYTYIRSSEYN